MFEEIIHNATQKSKEVNSLSDHDYVKNNLVFCGKCNTPRQTVVELFGVLQTVWCDCQCRSDEYLQSRQKFHQKMDDYAKENKRSLCFQYAPELSKCRFSFDDGKGDRQAMQNLLRYAENFPEIYRKGSGLLIYGNCGTGKTYGAACIANHLIDSGYSAFMVTFNQIINTAWSEKNKQEYFNSLNDYDLLIIDDYGAERTNSEHVLEIVTSVFDRRYTSGKPLVITTNLKPTELKQFKNQKEERIRSRIIGMCVPVMYVGDDRRNNQLNDNAEFLRNIFRRTKES